MLIDETYFQGGPLNIPQDANSNARLTKIRQAIEFYERQFLERALSGPLMDAFLTGLQQTEIEDRFLKILGGTGYFSSYTFGGSQRFRGLVENLGANISASVLQTVAVRVGRGQPGDPVSGASTMATPASLIGKTFTLQQRSFGELMAGIDYNISNGGTAITLLNNAVFSLNDWYYFQPQGISIITQQGSVKRSPIANYVYYYFSRQDASTTTSNGEVAIKGTASDRVSGEDKQTAAWNDMVGMLRPMYSYLSTNQAIYPEFVYSNSASFWPLIQKIPMYGF